MMSKESANAIYDLLVKMGDAPKTYQEHFVLHFTSEEPPREWRFQGSLGFGGKFYVDRDRWRVGCYREDDTPERLRTIEEMNKALERLYETRASHEETTDHRPRLR